MAHLTTNASANSATESKDPAIENISYGKCENSRFIETTRMFFDQNGQKKAWDLVKSHNAVAVLVYHRTKKCFLLVKQFRPAVYSSIARLAASNSSDSDSDGVVAPKPDGGFTYEMVAGLVDKSKSLDEIAKEEIEEEIGYRVDAKSLEYVSHYRSAVGVAGNKCEVYYAEVDEEMRVSAGGGIDSECIQVIELPVVKAKEFALSTEVESPAGLMFAIFWWLDKYRSKLEKL